MRVSSEQILEAKELLNLYAKEVYHELKPEIIPDKELYRKLEDSGVLDCFAEFDDARSIVGFITILTFPVLHYSKICTSIESFYVISEHRKGGLGKRLIKEAEDCAKKKGA